jgi:hypothetical protein
MKKSLCLAAVLVLGVCLINGLTLVAQQPAAGDKAQPELKAYLDAIRTDLRTEKKAILTKAMQFTPEEDKAFWPLYNAYLVELTKLGDERLAIIKVYAQNADKMTNAVATDMAKRSIAVQKQKTALLEKYYDQIAKVISPIKAARFLQIENALNMLIDIQVVAEIPLIQ